MTLRLRAILNLTCGGGAAYIPSPENDGIAGPGTDVGTVANRTQHIRENLPEVCSLDVQPRTRSTVKRNLYIFIGSGLFAEWPRYSVTWA